MTREQQIDQEARSLWQALKGDTPPAGLRGSELLDALLSGSEAPSYGRLHSPFLRESQISGPARV